MNKNAYLIFSILFIIFFLGLSFISPGWIYVLDFVVTPFTTWQNFFSTTLQWQILDIVNYFFWNEVTSKLYYLFVFVLWLFTASKLWKQLYVLLNSPKNKLWIYQAITALFLLCNPWTYERLVTQPWIAVGMFAMWLWISYLIENIFETKKYSLLWASISFAFAFMLFPHASVMILLIWIVYIALYYKTVAWKYYFIAPLIIIWLNANWIIGSLFFGAELGTNYAASFNRWDIEVFVWNSLSNLWVDITHLLLYGFWGEKYHILTPDKFNEYWYVFGIIALCIIVYGNVKLYMFNKRFFVFLNIVGFFSFVLALGIASPIFGWLSNWLYANIPGYIWMREPQKWLWVTMLCYTIFFVFSIDDLWKRFPLIWKYMLLFIVFVLMNTWNPMNLFWYQKQLYWITIPSEYRDTALKQYNTDPKSKYLLLPWHTYMGCSWSRWKNILSQQTNYFYPLQTIVADNIEIAQKYSNSSSPTSQNVEKYLQNKDISLLQEENISYIIYQKDCADASKYIFLAENPELYMPVEENNFVNIYQINYE